MSVLVWGWIGRYSSEQVWTGLRWWTPDVTSRVGMSRGIAMSGERGGYVREGGLGCPYSSCGGKNANIANFVYYGKTLVTQLLRNMFLPPANDIWGKVIFLQLSVILVTGGFCMMSLPVWLPSTMFFLVGLCAWSHAPSQGISVRRRGLC